MPYLNTFIKSCVHNVAKPLEKPAKGNFSCTLYNTSASVINLTSEVASYAQRKVAFTMRSITIELTISQETLH